MRCTASLHFPAKRIPAAIQSGKPNPAVKEGRERDWLNLPRRIKCFSCSQTTRASHPAPTQLLARLVFLEGERERMRRRVDEQAAERQDG